MKDIKPTELHYKMEPANIVRSFLGKTFVLNSARKISLWRKIRHKLEWSERDTLILSKAK